MAKLKEEPIQIVDLQEFVEGQDDFRLETAVLRICQLAGISVEHGGSYEDPVTKKSRQFDLRAIQSNGNRTIRWSIECKSLGANFPLLISKMPRVGSESRHQIVFSRPQEAMEMMGSNYYSLSVKDPHSIYKVGEYVGKSTAQVGRDHQEKLVSNDGEFFEKWSQAISSGFDLVERSISDYTQFEDCALSVVFPVLLVNDGALWVVDYDKNGQVVNAPTQVNNCDLYLGRQIWTGAFGIKYTFTHLHVFTLAYLEEYFRQIVQSPVYWDSVFPVDAIDRALFFDPIELH